MKLDVNNRDKRTPPASLTTVSTIYTETTANASSKTQRRPRLVDNKKTLSDHIPISSSNGYAPRYRKRSVSIASFKLCGTKKCHTHDGTQHTEPRKTSKKCRLNSKSRKNHGGLKVQETKSIKKVKTNIPRKRCSTLPKRHPDTTNVPRKKYKKN